MNIVIKSDFQFSVSSIRYAPRHPILTLSQESLHRISKWK